MANDKTTVKMITDLSNAFGPSGFEDRVVSTAKEYANEFCLIEDNIRNLFITPKDEAQNKPVVMLDAHSDEVGFMIHSIKPDGTLRFVVLGSFAEGSLPSMRVLVENSEGGLIPGVICAVPPHYNNGEKKPANDISRLVIDIGASNKNEAEEIYKIEIGRPAAPNTQCVLDENNEIIFGKAFDCRIGCAALIETMKRLKDEKLEVSLSGVLSSQEEVGGRGVMVAVNRIKPSAAICFEGCPADDTIAESYAQQTILKHGPMLRFIDKTMITNPRFQRLALKIASEKNIKVQGGVREGGGTNGGIIHTSNEGVPTIVIGIPVRYIHSPNCIVALEDFESSVSLAVEIIKELNGDIINSF